MAGRRPFETCDITVNTDIVPPWAPVCDELVLEDSKAISNSPDGKIPDVAVPPDCQCFPDITLETGTFNAYLTVTVEDVSSVETSVVGTINDLSTEDKDECEHPCNPDPKHTIEITHSATIKIPCIAFEPEVDVTISSPLTGSLTLTKETGCKLKLGGSLGISLSDLIECEVTGPGVTYVKCCEALNSNITLTAEEEDNKIKLTLCVDIKIPLLGLLDDEGDDCSAETSCPDP